MLTWLLYLVGDGLARVLPQGAAERASTWIGRLLFALRVPARRHLERNLERLLGPGREPEVEATARAAFENFALGLTDFLRLGGHRRRVLDQVVEVHGAEHLAAARASGCGVILISAHLGSWELGAAWLARAGTPVHVLARPHPSARVERFYARRRGACGVGMLADRPLWSAASAVLRRSEWIALMVDRRASTRAGPAQAEAAAWAAALSRRTGALVLPGVIVRLPGRRFAAHFDRPRQVTGATVDGVLDLLREQVRRHPAQWAAFEPLPEGLA